MIVYTHSEACEKLAYLLEEADRKGETLIRRRDGEFVVHPGQRKGSARDVPSVDLA